MGNVHLCNPTRLEPVKWGSQIGGSLSSIKGLTIEFLNKRIPDTLLLHFRPLAVKLVHQQLRFIVPSKDVSVKTKLKKPSNIFLVRVTSTQRRMMTTIAPLMLKLCFERNVDLEAKLDYCKY
jgi:hypothetical protein